MSGPRTLVLSGLGINCERETADAFRLAGSQSEIVHINALERDPGRIDVSDLVVFPGGFSFGDRLGAGQALAARIRHRRSANGSTLHSRLERFVRGGGYLLGICNGFQVLTKLGLLPNTAGDGRQEAALARNLSGRFEDRWCRLAAATEGPAAPFSDLGTIELPVRHGEGRLVFRDDAIRQAVIDRSLRWLTYVGRDGAPAAEYPANPNGADLSCAGLVDPSGHVFGLMPHPEAYISLYTHYNWPRRVREEGDTSDDGDGLRLIRSLVHMIAGAAVAPR